MRSDLKRLRTLARRRGLCPTHAARLYCCICDFTWAGTEAEFEELGALIHQSRVWDPPFPYQACPRCGADALCPKCCKGRVDQAPVHPDPLSPAQRARYDVLIQHGGIVGFA